jgi:BolA protein
MDRVAWIEQTLRAAFAPSHLVVEDESALHAGHAGAAGGGGHFRGLGVSAAFEGQDLVARQRAVYAALGSAMKTDIHALALRTLTPEEWDRT